MTCSAFMLIGLDEYKDYQLSSMTSNPLMNHDLCNFEMNWYDLESLKNQEPVQWLGQPPPSHIHSCSWPSASNTARNPLWSSCKPFQNVKTLFPDVLDTGGWETFLSRKLSLPSTPPARCASNLGCVRSFGLLLWFELMNYYYYY